MVTKELLDYIRNAAISGRDFATIKEEMLANGWEDGDINSALKECNMDIAAQKQGEIATTMTYSEVVVGEGFEKTPTNQGPKVLIVEDDRLLRETMVRKFLSKGFRVKSAIDYEESMDVLHEEKPDIILLDLILPGEKNGFSILSHLKTDNRMKTVPVIVLSNLGQQNDIDKAKMLGAVGFMIKANYSLNEIVEKVDGVLNERPAVFKALG
ncbi:MAG: hypothetical protein CO088_02625 [Candidatus Yonathbacteria bacterium CG_4_9_14_0_8_um_filter_46_47]|uniref:Response regulatory domain-containing protein n=2 Tax=Parcubacteria group TaxID=1794811 RepID=A0A2M8D726_9BACT|nr:MAG: hypothetical protein CO088_02625 [Candidatus Yonathbacteria bacterium CG_4_9_14_0_8_um_filter_46_47]